ncbi:MAG: hypothetical protein U5K56_17500 [Halioglobus sp.]|nr:hypothetical protein [Halioglobus sp.]
MNILKNCLPAITLPVMSFTETILPLPDCSGPHVIIGLCVLVYALQFGTRGTHISDRFPFHQNSGMYWHMVNLLGRVIRRYLSGALKMFPYYVPLPPPSPLFRGLVEGRAKYGGQLVPAPLLTTLGNERGFFCVLCALCTMRRRSLSRGHNQKFSVHKYKYFVVLVLLLALTLLSWLVLYVARLEPKTVGVLLLCLAFVKVQLIISQYMESNKAILSVRVAFWIWTITAGTISIGIYLH